MDIWNIRWTGDAIATVLGTETEKTDKKTPPDHFSRKDIELRQKKNNDRNAAPPDKLAA